MTLFVSLFVIKTVGTTDLRFDLITNELGHGLIHRRHGCREGTRVAVDGCFQNGNNENVLEPGPFVRGCAHLLGLAKRKGKERHHGESIKRVMEGVPTITVDLPTLYRRKREGPMRRMEGDQNGRRRREQLSFKVDMVRRTKGPGGSIPPSSCSCSCSCSCARTMERCRSGECIRRTNNHEERVELPMWRESTKEAIWPMRRAASKEVSNSFIVRQSECPSPREGRISPIWTPWGKVHDVAKDVGQVGLVTKGGRREENEQREDKKKRIKRAQSSNRSSLDVYFFLCFFFSFFPFLISLALSLHCTYYPHPSIPYINSTRNHLCSCFFFFWLIHPSSFIYFLTLLSHQSLFNQVISLQLNFTQLHLNKAHSTTLTCLPPLNATNTLSYIQQINTTHDNKKG